MTTEIINWEDAQVQKVLIETVAKGANQAEFAMFREMCKATGLNPFKKEIWFIKTKNAVHMMTGINGFYTIANSHPQFDGTEIEYGPAIEVEDSGRKFKVVEHVTCKVFRKDRSRPTVAVAYFEEFKRPMVSTFGNLTIWGEKPRVMLSKCAESMALRKAFPQELDGLNTEEELGIVEVKQEDVVPSNSNVMTDAQEEQEKAKRAAAYAKQQVRKQAEQMVKEAMGRSEAWQYMADADDDKKALIEACEAAGIAFYGDKKEKCLWTISEIPDADMYCTYSPEADFEAGDQQPIFEGLEA